MAFSSHRTAFEFIKSYANRFSTSRMYQTIRVIRPQPQSQTASLLKDVPNGKLVVFAMLSGIGGSSLFYLMSKPGALEAFTTSTSSLSAGTGEQPVGR
jgi:hypothetical protein